MYINTKNKDDDNDDDINSDEGIVQDPKSYYPHRASPKDSFSTQSSKICSSFIVQDSILFRHTSSARVAAVLLLAVDDVALTAKHLMLDVDLVAVR